MGNLLKKIKRVKKGIQEEVPVDSKVKSREEIVAEEYAHIQKEFLKKVKK